MKFLNLFFSPYFLKKNEKNSKPKQKANGIKFIPKQYKSCKYTSCFLIECDNINTNHEKQRSFISEYKF